ncbi:MAG TPA: DNA adenine methylase [Geobacterales bacterium]|nr:DNA adenine methylase [Geobacterales bacterium]
MGSKQRILNFIFKHVDKLNFDTVLDAFSGSGSVAYEFKRRMKQVDTNDMLHFSYATCKAIIENNDKTITAEMLEELMRPRSDASNFITKNFGGVFFTKQDCTFLDSLWRNIQDLNNEYQRYLAIAAATRACQKAYPRGTFTVAKAERRKKARPDFWLRLQDHFAISIRELNHCVLNNRKRNKSYWSDIFKFKKNDYDLVYLDPPYPSKFSDNNYVRRYHFIEGFSLYWKNLEIDAELRSKKFQSHSAYPNMFVHEEMAKRSLIELFEKFSKSIIALSYSSNCRYSWQQVYRMLEKVKGRKHVQIHYTHHTYSLGNRIDRTGNLNNRSKEFLFIAK